MKILLTGANGFVGKRIQARLPVIAAPSLRTATKDDVRLMIDTVQPDIIIHTAAISDIGACERDTDASWHANVLVPEYIAQSAGKAKQIYFSSDQVYGGVEHRGPYREDDTAPANTYARHKLAMEEAVLAAAPDAVLLRATWMYDMPMYGADNRGNFLMGLLMAAARGESLSPGFVCLVIYDCSNSADNLSVLVCEIVFRLAEIKGTVLFLVESVHVVERHRRYIIFVSLIKPVGVSYESLEVFPCGYSLDLN